MKWSFNNKGELSPQEIQQRKKMLVYPLFITAFLIVVYFIFVPSLKKNEEEEKAGINASIPEPTNKEIWGNKKNAYEEEFLLQKQDEKMKTLQDYSFSLERNGEEAELNLFIEEENTVNFDSVFSTPRNNLAMPNIAHQNMTRGLNDFYKSSSSDAERRNLENKIEELTKRLETAEAGNNTNDAEKLMEKSYQMAAKYLNVGAGGQSEPKPEPKQPVKHEKVSFTPVSNVAENVVSRLPQPISDSAFIAEYTKERNWEFNTVGIENKETSRNTIRASVLDNQVLTFGNGEEQKVRFRLLENVQAGDFIIPRNNIVSGDAKLTGGRLDITITSIEYAGNILPVKLIIYDTEGQKGIAAPNSMETSALKEAAGNAGAGLGTSVSFSQNAGQQVAMDLTRGVMQTGSQYLSKKIKTVKIMLKANHPVLILSSEN